MPAFTFSDARGPRPDASKAVQPACHSNYNYFRDYDPATGRYDESDLIGLRGGLNTYAYVLNDPIRRIDPRGLVPGPHTGPAKPPVECNSEEPDCRKIYDKCLEKCSDDALPTYGDYQPVPFWKCVNKCMEDNGCGPDKKPLPVAPLVPSPVKPPRPVRPPVVPIVTPGPTLVTPPLPMLNPCLLMPDLAACHSQPIA